MELTLNILWFVLIGVMTAIWASALFTPDARRYGDGGLFFLAITGALIGGFLFPAFGWFSVPLALLGTLVLSFLGSILFLGLISLLFLILMPVKEIKHDEIRQV